MSIRETMTTCGPVRGVAAGDPRVVVYKGIPFAEAPVGDLRWRAPVPKMPWEGVFDAVRYGNICPQALPGKDTFYCREFFMEEDQETMSEDCLQLNVWTPAESKEDRLPVLVFIHGGGFQTNYSFAKQFDGEQMARHDIVVVTINYRVGIFGFLAHPDLAAEDPQGRAGNYGLLDQICALEWVRDNITAFGGDPEKVTISGGSAGAASCLTLALSSLAKGLFRGAIMQSGPIMELCSDMSEAVEDGRKFLERIGYASIEAMRKAPADEIKCLGPNLDKGDRMFLSPCVDGFILEDSYENLLKAGKQHDINYIVGSCKDEARAMRNRFFATPDKIAAKLENCYGKYSEEYRQVVSCSTPEEAFDFQLNHGFTEDMRVYCMTWVEMCEKYNPGVKNYLYSFERQLPGDDNGAFHASEHWYVFQTLNHCWRPFTGVDYDMANTVAAFWSNFIKNGDPNGEGLPQWDTYKADHKVEMVLDEKCGQREVLTSKAVDIRVKYMCE